MELNSSTFILEIINFLVLVWILKRFFYQPVLDVIARRKAGIEETLTKAELLQSTAEDLQGQYEMRLTHWEQEKQAARQSLDDDICSEREERLATLQSELEVEREKEAVLIRQKLEDERQKNVDTALNQGAQFATRLLCAVSSSELEQRLTKLLLDDLEKLPAEQLDRLHTANGIETGVPLSKSSSDTAITITSAYPLDATIRKAVEQACAKILPSTNQFHYQQDPDLIAGLRISVGSWVLAANLQDELKGFTSFEHEH
ncbi:MAG: F0F1 ATP synthase subunit delta [Porticoccaceae bacterium]|nr:F0F1 ATP synthase subunit delta [Porticoccaceae bacterium]